jgi:hypothetical protein
VAEIEKIKPNRVSAPMTSVGLVTRQIAALEISAPKHTVAPRAHIKQPSQTNVSKLLTKFAVANAPISAAQQQQPSSSSAPPSRPASPAVATGTGKPGIDIGRYDGGFEKDDEVRGEKVYGEAAKELALDSSASRYA